jgi:hypothetical protein
MEKETPRAVKEQARNLIDLFGEKISYIGRYKTLEAYLFQFPRNMLTGFPYVYLYDVATDKATETTGFAALSILCEVEKINPE